MEELSRKQEDNIRSEKVKAKFKEEMASVNTFNVSIDIDVKIQKYKLFIKPIFIPG